MNSNYRPSTTVINIKEIVWDLLSQWKAVLIAALVVMLLLPGLKYAKDMKAYNSAQDAGAVEAEAGITPEQKIEDILSALPEDERATIEYLVKQEDWIRAEKEYISDSIFINLDPTNQRTLMLDYIVSAQEGSDADVLSLTNAYSAFLTNERLIGPLGQAIDPDADSRYIAELIRTNSGNNFATNTGRTLYVDADDGNTVMSIYIALPEETDTSAVEAAVTGALKDYSSELAGKIGPHSISLLQTSESYIYNNDAINNRNNVLYSIYNLTNNTKNMKTSLSDAQKTAVESISAIKKAEAAGGDDQAEEAEPQEASKPGFSKKYALLGFVLGALAYAFVYLLLVIMKGCVNSASDVEYYTQSRLLGEVYDKVKTEGFSKLLHSDFVEKTRYRGKTDPETQTAKAVDAVAAVCEHAQIKKLTLFDMAGKAGTRVNGIVDEIRNKGIDAETIDASGGIEEKSLLDVENALLVAGPETKVSSLTGLMSLCADYDVRSLGSIYSA